MGLGVQRIQVLGDRSRWAGRHWRPNLSAVFFSPSSFSKWRFGIVAAAILAAQLKTSGGSEWESN